MTEAAVAGPPHFQPDPGAEAVAGDVGALDPELGQPRRASAAPRLAAVGSTPAGSDGAVPKPGRSSAITRRSDSSSGTTGSQTLPEAPSPWISSSGSRPSPVEAPPRSAAVAAALAHCHPGLAKRACTSPIRRSRKPASEEVR